MKIFILDKMLMTWAISFLALAAYTKSSTISGFTTSVKAVKSYLEEANSDKNVSIKDMTITPSRFDMELQKPKTLKEYLYDVLVNGDSAKLPKNGKVAVVARIGDFDKDISGDAEWKIISEPAVKKEFLNQSTEDLTASDYVETSLDYLLENDEIQKYIYDYQDMIYTFKDFVKIGANPKIKEKLTEKTDLFQDIGKKYNVTYVMPIPKTKKYFEIKMSNLSEIQYNEINTLLQEHMEKHSNRSTHSDAKEDGIVYVDISDEKKHLSSRDLTEISGLTEVGLDSTSGYNSSLKENWPSNTKEAMEYFQKVFTEEAYNDFVKSLRPTLNLKVNQTINAENETKPSLMKNNGFHAEITTDYIHKHEDNQVNKNESSTFNAHSTDSLTASAKSINTITPTHLEIKHTSAEGNATHNSSTKNPTKPIQLPRSKRPIINHPSTNQRKLQDSSIASFGIVSTTPIAQHRTNRTELNSGIPIAITPALEKLTGNEINRVDNSDKVIVPEIKKKETDRSQDNASITVDNQDWVDITKLYINGGNNQKMTPALPNQDSNPTFNPPEPTNIVENSNSMNIMQAANWIIEFKRRIEEEERIKNERYKNYIKKFLGGNNSSLMLPAGEYNSVMKINKQDDILQGLKSLMLSYFESMDFNTREAINVNSSSTEESILNSTNIFELMERSSQLIKQHLQRKMQVETKEPTGFVKKIVDTQIEKCKHIFNNSLLAKVKQKSPELFKRKSHRRYTMFTRCVNFKIKKCIKGFNMWLEKGGFYLRHQFKLARAYENYEIEKNLYCLRTYNGSYMESNPHRVRVRPQVKGKPRMRKIKMKQNRLRMRKLRNRGYNTQVAKRNMKMNRINNKNSYINDHISKK